MLDIGLRALDSDHLPVDYRSGFMSIIKGSIESESKVLYDLIFGGRTVKPYTFAVTFGRGVKIHCGNVFFSGPISFKFSSYDPSYEIYLYNYLVERKKVGLYGRSFEVCWIRFVRKRDIISSSAVFRTLSPVLIRSHENENHYLCPKCENFDGDSGFNEAFMFNMKELTRNLMGTECGDVELEPIKLKRIVVKHMAKYGELKFPAFVGTFRLSASPDVLNLVNRGGIGSRRSEGFGMIELVRDIKKEGGHT